MDGRTVLFVLSSLVAAAAGCRSAPSYCKQQSVPEDWAAKGVPGLIPEGAALCDATRARAAHPGSLVVAYGYKGTVHDAMLDALARAGSGWTRTSDNFYGKKPLPLSYEATLRSEGRNLRISVGCGESCREPKPFQFSIVTLQLAQ
jgi:hypothetical protein